MYAADVNRKSSIRTTSIEIQTIGSAKTVFVSVKCSITPRPRYIYALTASNAIKLGIPRLGAGGGVQLDKLHPDLKEKVENLNCGQRRLNWGTRFALG